MAKRFTDSEKWKDPFFENLSKDFKLAWLYLLDDCDHAGIWQKSIKRLNFSIDSNLTESDLLNEFKERIIVLNNDKWFIPKFITFQYGNDFINSKQKAVVSAVKLLNENDLIKELGKGSYTLKCMNPSTNTIPLTNPMVTLMDKETDMDKVMSKDMDKSMDESMDSSMSMDMDKADTLTNQKLISDFEQFENEVKNGLNKN